jgi:elongation factor Ts
MILTEQIKQLREQTGIPVMQCKKALEEANGDNAKALIILRKVGKERAVKVAERELSSGAVVSYVHNSGTVGAIVLLGSETDFVSRSDEFRSLAYDIAMHITALDPQCVTRDEVDDKEIKSVKEVFEKETDDKAQGKQDLKNNTELKEKIISSKMDAYFREKILLEQRFIKDDKKTIKDLLDEAMLKFGERINVLKFSRISL